MALTQIKSTLLVPQAVGWVPLASSALSGTSVSFESNIDSTYDHYMFVGTNVHVGTDDVFVRFLVGTGATPTYQEDDYEFHYNSSKPGAATYVGGYGTGQEYGLMCQQMGNGAAENLQFTMRFSSPDIATMSSIFQIESTMINVIPQGQITNGATVWTPTTAITAIKFLPHSGSFDGGTIALYGLAP